MFDPNWRQRALRDLDNPFDVVVVGGGITGCGVLLDAAQRGLRVLLVERGDIASGTSSRSSKLIHGGLRYLTQLQFGVTRLACRERDRLLALNPHLVSPIRFVMPAYGDAKLPGWKVRLGLRLYDRLTSRPEKHHRLDGIETEALAPGLARENLRGAVSFADALVDDARLTLAVAATGHAHGGRVLTRCALEEGLPDSGGRVSGLIVRDLETGATHRVETGVIVNAAGHWVDEVRRRFELEEPRLPPSRGVHLVFDRRRLPLETALTIASPEDGRPVAVVPHPEGVLVGTTDIFHEGSLDDPRATREEVDYLLGAVNAAFPRRPSTWEDIVGVFAGLRPIVDDRASDPSKASREEAIWQERALISVAGGKLTTCRPTAERAVDRVVGSLPEERRRLATPCRTAGTPLAGLAPADLEQSLCASAGLGREIAAAMARRLGALAWTACELAKSGELEPLADGLDLSAAEVRAHLRFGAVLRLDDLLLRRVRLGMWRPSRALEIVDHLRPVVTRELDWGAKRWEAELEALARSPEGWAPAGAR